MELEPFINCPREECPRQFCFKDTHHIFWPKEHYKTELERQFRNLPENQIKICRWLHDTIHQGNFPPKPSEIDMWNAVEADQIARDAVVEYIRHSSSGEEA